MGMKFTNFATSTLASGILAGSTSLSVFAGDGAKFPTLGVGDYFYAVLDNLSGTREIIKVTARTGDSFSTIVRAQDGTSALAWNAGDKVELRLVNLGLVELTASEIHDATNKTTPVDADEIGITDSAASYGLKKLPWSNLKATLKTYFDTLYTSLATVLATANLWTAQQRPQYLNTATAAGGGSFTYDPPTHGQIALITCSTAGTLTFNAPTNIVEGAPYTLMLKAGDTNARTPAFNAAFKWKGGSCPITALSTTVGAIDTLDCIGGAGNTLIYHGHSLDVR